MVDSGDDLDRIWAAYEADLVRWNRQINLVSRQDTQRRVADLIQQCRLAWRDLAPELAADWAESDPVLYFDLGSGGGLPGVVWHHHLVRRHARVQTVLVEPREKRAWFLQRQAERDPAHPIRVHNGRWGDQGRLLAQESIPRRILVSLKALHLPDPAVLQGLVTATAGTALPAGGSVVIVRFAPPDQVWDDRLAASLGAIWPRLTAEAYKFRAGKRSVVGPGPGGTAALIISTYHTTPAP